MVTVGGIIGAGIFLSPAVVAQRVHTSAAVLGVWVLGGVIAVAGALTFAELGGRRPQAGGGYVYLREAFGPLPAFLYGWTFLVVINTGGMAAVAVTFARYTVDLAGALVRGGSPVGRRLDSRLDRRSTASGSGRARRRRTSSRCSSWRRSRRSSWPDARGRPRSGFTPHRGLSGGTDAGEW